MEMHWHLHQALGGVWGTDDRWHCCLPGDLWGPLLGNSWRRLNGLLPFTVWVYMWTVIQLKNVKFTYCIFIFNIIIDLVCICYCLTFPSPSGFFEVLLYFSVFERELKCYLKCPFLVFSLTHHENRPSTGPAKEKFSLLSSNKMFLRVWKYVWITHHEKFWQLVSTFSIHKIFLKNSKG